MSFSSQSNVGTDVDVKQTPPPFSQPPPSHLHPSMKLAFRLGLVKQAEDRLTPPPARSAVFQLGLGCILPAYQHRYVLKKK
jgi:hypothetical protein